MTQDDTQLLESIQQMIDEAPQVGLCAMPFRIIYQRMDELMRENYILRQIVYPDAK